MALNESDRELLAVIKYFNEQRAKKRVSRLVAKLDKDFGRNATVDLTGFTVKDIREMVEATPTRKKPETVKVNGKKVVGSFVADTVKMFDEVLEPEKPKNPITIDSDSSLHERIAYEMSMQIGAKFKPGNAFYTTKQAMEVFECGKETAQGALVMLREKGLIEYANGNWRKGYVVK